MFTHTTYTEVEVALVPQCGMCVNVCKIAENIQGFGCEANSLMIIGGDTKNLIYI